VIQKGGTVKWEVVYRNFRADLRTDEFIKIIQALVDAGILATYQDEKNKGTRWIEHLDLDEEMAA
jgi:predicted transcriptional regulator